LSPVLASNRLPPGEEGTGGGLLCRTY